VTCSGTGLAANRSVLVANAGTSSPRKGGVDDTRTVGVAHRCWRIVRRARCSEAVRLLRRARSGWDRRLLRVPWLRPGRMMALAAGLAELTGPPSRASADRCSSSGDGRPAARAALRACSGGAVSVIETPLPVPPRPEPEPPWPEPPEPDPTPGPDFTVEGRGRRYSRSIRSMSTGVPEPGFANRSAALPPRRNSS
jgi:hypothetical protein